MGAAATKIKWKASFGDDVKSLAKTKKHADRSKKVKELFALIKARSFVYKDDKELKKGRDALLDCWEFLLREVDLMPYGERALFFRATILLMMREEFDFARLADKAAQQQWEVKLAIRYRDLLYDTQLYAMKKLAQQHCYPILLSFCADVLAINYFCLGSLAPMVLGAVWTTEDEAKANEDFPELTTQIKQLIEQTTAKQTEDEVTRAQYVTASSKYFCQVKWLLGSLDGNAAQEQKLATVPADWMSRLVEKGEYFHEFLQRLAFRVQDLVPDHPQWGLVPGYYQLLQVFLFEIRKAKKSTGTMPKTALECSKTLLSNRALLNSYFSIYFLSTSVHNLMSVLDTLNTAEEWFEIVSDTGGIPKSFNFDFFFKGIRILLDSDLFHVLMKTLAFLHNTLELFEDDAWTTIVEEILLKENFFKLFLHWEDDVRKIFHRMLIFKVIHTTTERAEKEQPTNQPAPPPPPGAKKPAVNPQPPPPPPVKKKITEKDIVTSLPLVDGYITKVEAQKGDPSLHHYPKELSVYAALSLKAYASCIDEYKKWRLSSKGKPPKVFCPEPQHDALLNSGDLNTI